MNGQVERAIGILGAKMRALLMDLDTHKKHWPLAMETATYLLNRTPHESLKGMSPLEIETGDKPDLRRARVFGCKAYVQVTKAQRRGKLSNTVWQGAMVGYSTRSPEWLILDPRSNRLRTAYSVTFNEQAPGLRHGPSNHERPGHATQTTTDTEEIRPTLEREAEATARVHQHQGTEESSEVLSPEGDQEVELENDDEYPPHMPEPRISETPMSINNDTLGTTPPPAQKHQDADTVQSKPDAIGDTRDGESGQTDRRRLER